MASIEHNNADWKEMRIRVDSIASAVFLIGGGALSLSMSVVISNFENLTISMEMVSDISSAWLSLFGAIGLALFMKIYMVFQSFLLQEKTKFMDNNYNIFNIGGWVVGGLSFILFCIGFYLTVFFGINLISEGNIIPITSPQAKAALVVVDYSVEKYNQQTYWVEYIPALVLPFIAILGLYIAYSQWRTNQNKLKLELFRMRFMIYEACTDFIRNIMKGGVVTDQILLDFLASTKEAKWLFNSEIASYLENDLYKNGVDLQCFRSELEGVGVGEKRSTNLNNQAAIKKWLLSQFKVLDEKFERYLRIKH